MSDLPRQLPSYCALVRRKWVYGCACGCRGDFVITPAGMQEIASADDACATGALES